MAASTAFFTSCLVKRFASSSFSRATFCAITDFSAISVRSFFSARWSCTRGVMSRTTRMRWGARFPEVSPHETCTSQNTSPQVSPTLAPAPSRPRGHANCQLREQVSTPGCSSSVRHARDTKLSMDSCREAARRALPSMDTDERESRAWSDGGAGGTTTDSCCACASTRGVTADISGRPGALPILELRSEVEMLSFFISALASTTPRSAAE
mmetsp:Transcript_10223/g.30195  ORF Transcript_10223/g.30195 Transcript_10223/m.30195 type:complete len:211 (-) Transcript_10223:1216-1848(-)